MTRNGNLYRACAFNAALLVALVPAAAFDSELTKIPHVNTLPAGLPPFILDDDFGVAQARLGEFLFFDPALSRDGAVGCVNCHDPKFAFTDGHRLPRPRGWEVGHRNSPSISNLYYGVQLMWDGRANGIREQVAMPLSSADEINIDWPTFLLRFSKTKPAHNYLISVKRERIRVDDVINSLSSFVRSIVTLDSPFDRYFYLKDDGAITNQARRGLILFSTKANCTSCHLMSGEFSLFTDNRFHALGIGVDDSTYSDRGRYNVTKADTDIGRFKTPSLRNVARTSPYMHDGSFKSLREVVDYYNRGGNIGTPNLDDKIRPLNLSNEEIDDLLAFLNSLTSDLVVFDPLARNTGASE